MSMDRRSFIKLTAVTGGATAIAACSTSSPENRAHSLRARRRPDAGHRGTQERRLPDLPRRLRHDRARDAGRRRRRPQRTARRDDDEPRQEARRQRVASDQPGRAVSARSGVDPDHVSPRSHHSAAQASRRSRQRRLSARVVGRSNRRARRHSSTLSGPERRGSLRSRGPARARATTSSRCSSRSSAAWRRSSTSCSATTCCGARISSVRPRAGADVRLRQRAPRPLVRRRLPRHLGIAGLPEWRATRKCAADGRAFAAR